MVYSEHRLVMESLLSKLYYDSSSPAGFSSVAKLYNIAKREIPELKLGDVKDWLSGQLTYTLHKPARRRFVRNPIIVEHYNEQWQADLVDMQEFSRANQGYKYILTVIDLLSKYAYAVPLKDKRGKTVKTAFIKLFNKNVPSKLQTDQGTEFKNSVVKALFESKKINYFTTKN